MSNNIIAPSVLKSGAGPICGVVLVKDYDVKKTKSNKDYIAGTIVNQDVSIGFKVWDNSAAFTEFNNYDYTNTPCLINGKFDNFGGQQSIIIDTVNAVDGVAMIDFLETKYDSEAYFNALKTLGISKVSEKGIFILNEVLFENEAVRERFKVEFAAYKYHDNCKGGLLAHTYKVTKMLEYVLAMYPKCVNNNQDFIDMMYTGAILHDVGKINEMEYGVYQSDSRVTHVFLGLEYIMPLKERIVEAYSLTWYYNLVSIILQHHDEFGERCKTLASRIINYCDVMDANLTLLETEVEKGYKDEADNVKVNGVYYDIRIS